MDLQNQIDDDIIEEFVECPICHLNIPYFHWDQHYKKEHKKEARSKNGKHKK